MATKTDRIETRVSPVERERIDRAAELAGNSVSRFIVDAALIRADEVIAAYEVTEVPSDYFDALLDAIDTPSSAPQLARAASRRNRISK